MKRQSFAQFLESIRGLRIAVLGIGVSNRPLLALLHDAGAFVTACDRKDRAALGAAADELDALGIELRTGEHYLDELDHDLIFRTPGLRPDAPGIAAAVAAGSRLTSEMEVFFSVCPCPIIGVTGSDGKTTTTTLIYEMLTRAGKTCHLGGNIGHPLLADTPSIAPGDLAVVELSSFQLMTMRQSPDIAVITNLGPNHLDVHTSMDEYTQAKENIYLYQGNTGLFVTNDDNAITRAFPPRAKGAVRLFSTQRVVENGVFLRDGKIFSAQGGIETFVLDASDILLPGMHNAENYMAAIAAVRELVSTEAICETARTFRGVEHRMEYVRTLDGVRYYNDSMGTSPTRVIAGLRTYGSDVVLIAGGYDKNLPFDTLGEAILRHVRALVLVGAASDKIRAAVEAAPGYDPAALPIIACDTMAGAVLAARKLAKPGNIVTLSPACAAFDMYENFAARGRDFKALVGALS